MNNDDKNQPAMTKLGPYSVQWFDTDPGPCVCCGARVGSGPVGFRAEELAGPLCDNCLLERNMDLGMLLVMANVNREFANEPKPDDPSEGELLKTGLMTFSMMYDQAATWPRRRRVVLSFLRGLVKRFRQVPLGAMIKLMDGDTH